MSITLPFFWQSILAVFVYAIYLIPTGFLAAELADVYAFRKRSLPERFAWCVLLSFPISTLFAVLWEHFLKPSLMNVPFVAAAVMAVLLLHRAGHKSRQIFEVFRHPATLAIAAGCLYCLVAITPVLAHGRLEEGVFTNDWYIRIPLQYAALHSGAPPIQPLYTFQGHSPALRYYYFFYVFCSAPARLAHLTPRAALDGGAIWAAVAFPCMLFLFFKYLVWPTTQLQDGRDREGKYPKPYVFVVLFFVSLIGGLDLLPNIVSLMSQGGLFPTIFWWNHESIAPWLSTLPFVPHHMFGLAASFTGFLLLSHEQGTSEPALKAVARYGLAAACLAAASGTSTFVAFCILLSALVFGAAQWLLGKRHHALLIMAFLITTGILDLPYLRETFLSRDPANRSHSTPFPLKLVVAMWHHSYGETGSFFAHRLHRTPVLHGLGYFAVIPTLLLNYAVDLGFFWFVLFFQIRRDLLNGAWRQLDTQGRAVWCLFGTCSFIRLFVSSAPMQNGLNDLGRHAALCVRVILVVWATPMILDLMESWREHKRPSSHVPLFTYAALICAGLGLLSEVWDMTVQRFYLPLVDLGGAHPMLPFDYPPGTGFAYAELAQAWKVIDVQLAPSAVVQANPGGLLQRPVLLYLTRRVAAGDISCEASFGGDPQLCREQIVKPLLALYAQPQEQFRVISTPTLSSFHETCSSIGLAALIATADDPIWKQHDSWVWRAPVLFQSDQVRVLRCPS